MAGFRCSKRKVAVFLQEVLQVPCSPGWVVKLQNFATSALRPAYDDLVQRLPDQPRLNIDESPTKQARIKAWLWTFVAKTFTVFALRKSRKAEALSDHLGPVFTGVIGCDRAKMYLAFNRIQWCWAHLIRDFRSWIDGTDGAAKRLGRELQGPIGQVFELWWKVRDGTLSRQEFQTQVHPYRQKIDRLLLRGVYTIAGFAQATCEQLTEHSDRLWAFVDHDQVEPTNNAAERALRQAVIWRKLSFGTQSDAGSRFVETMLTIVETCRQQGRSAYDFAVEAITAHHTRKTPTLFAGA
jgi:transposase